MKDYLKKLGLTECEAKVGELVLHGLSNEECAGMLSLNEKTIKYHLTHIYKKLRVKSRSQFIVKVLKEKLSVEMRMQDPTLPSPSVLKS